MHSQNFLREIAILFLTLQATRLIKARDFAEQQIPRPRAFFVMSVSGELEPFPRGGASRIAGETPMVRSGTPQWQRELGAAQGAQRRGGFKLG